MSMTYRPSTEVLQAIADLKEQLDIKASSKVLDHVLLNFAKNKSNSKNIERKYEAQAKELYEVKKVLSDKREGDERYNKLIDNFFE